MPCSALAQSLDQQFQQNLDQSTRENQSENAKCNRMWANTFFLGHDNGDPVYISKNLGFNNNTKAYVLPDKTAYIPLYKSRLSKYDPYECKIGDEVKLGVQTIHKTGVVKKKPYKEISTLVKLDGDQIVEYTKIEKCYFAGDQAATDYFCNAYNAINEANNPGSGGIKRKVKYVNNPNYDNLIP